MITTNDINEDAVEECFKLLREHNHSDFDISEEDVWFTAWQLGFTCCEVPNFSNIYMGILFEYTHDVLKEKGIYSSFYINNQDSNFQIVEED